MKEPLILRRARAGALAAAICAAGLAGSCQTSADPFYGGPPFPAEKEQATTLDIQVVRDETQITLTNTTARRFGRSRLWLNRWFSRDIDGLGVGETLTLGLGEFHDRFGEPFRGGGFFASRNPEKLVQAQLETADSLIGLVVVARNEY